MAQSQSSETQNFLRQFRDKKTRDWKQITATQFMEVWTHYDKDGNGYIEGSELDKFLYELVTSVNVSDVGPEVVSQAALDEAKDLMMKAFDENRDGKIDITELAQFLPMEENFLLLFRRDHPLESSVEFMKVWREYDTDQSGYIEADELKNFLFDLLKQSEKETEVSEEQLITYADTMLQMFDTNRDGKLQLSEMAKLLPVKENFLCRPVFRTGNKLTKDDVEQVFALYDRDNNKTIENEELHGFLKDLMELVQEVTETAKSLMPTMQLGLYTLQDYDADDLDELKTFLLTTCDIKDGKINKEELTAVLMNRQEESWSADLTSTT